MLEVNGLHKAEQDRTFPNEIQPQQLRLRIVVIRDDSVF